MSDRLRLCLVLHNHQPVGNFDHVFEQAYQDSYLPFLDLFDRFNLPISLHTSGPLMEWLDANQRSYVDRIAGHVESGRIEVVGGAFYEPILTMISPCDRVGQITHYTDWLEQRLGGRARGMWVPERVWEQSLAGDLADSRIEYTVLDNTHFNSAGLGEEQLYGYYLTEENGKLLRVFPGSEKLRYLIPFRPPHETIEYLRHVASVQPDAVVVFGDDGEKFGTWPDTHDHVYKHGWLRQFFEQLEANSDWLHVTTLSEAADNVAPLGKVYIPQGSYREMTEWALPVERQLDYEDLVHDLHHDERWDRISQYMRGGFWRNFKVKYPEANEMYSRTMMVSQRLAEAEARGASGPKLDAARRELYRGQCNCSYWHGAFGGIYLPHLRNAVYNHLIAAENLLDELEGRHAPWIAAQADDYNFDSRQEVQLANDKLVCLLAPAEGGRLYELDVRAIQHNLLATLARRPEAYHRKVLAGANPEAGEVASIHDRVVFKQEGLNERLQYDHGTKKSLVDHFYAADVTHEAIARGEAEEHGDFVDGIYEARLRKNPDRIQVQLTRQGTAYGAPVTITKGLTLDAGSSTLEVAYLLEGLPQDRPLHFGVEWNFAGLPSGADDRFFYQGEGQRLGQLGEWLNLEDAGELGLCDLWLGIDLLLSSNQPTNLWTFPIETVSQSEGGFELVHQSVVVLPHWHVQPDANGRWSVEMRLGIETPAAEPANNPSPETVAAT